MPSLDLIRWGGPAAIAGGALFVIAELLDLYNFSGAAAEGEFSEVAATASWTAEALLFLLGEVLLLFGLFGLYARQSEAAGALGLAGFLVAFLGTALSAGISYGDAFILPYLAVEAPEVVDAGPPLGVILSFGVFTVGWVLFGLATLRARVYPRVAAVLLMVGAVLAFFPLSLSTVVFGVAIAWLGFVLFTGRGASAKRPSRVS